MIYEFLKIFGLANDIPAYEHGGEVGEYTDLFEDYDNMPSNLKKIVEKYEQKYVDGDMDYRETEKFLKEVEAIGYTFDYYLDNEPYGLRPIGVKLSQLEGYVSVSDLKKDMIVYPISGSYAGKKAYVVKIMPDNKTIEVVFKHKVGNDYQKFIANELTTDLKYADGGEVEATFTMGDPKELAKGGGIYSSDDRWVVIFQNIDSGEFEKVIVRANNKKNAIAIAEDESGLNSNWYYYSAEKEMAKGGEVEATFTMGDPKSFGKGGSMSDLFKKSKEAYHGSKSFIKGKIHDQKKNVALDVIYDVKENLASGKDEKRALEKAFNVVDNKYAKGGNIKESYLHVYKLTYPDGKYIVEAYDGEPMTPKEAMQKMGISLRGLKSYRYYGASSVSPNYKKWYDKKNIGYSDTEAFDEVFGDEQYAKGGKIDDNAAMVLNDNKQLEHHTKELPHAIEGKRVPAWVVAKTHQSATTMSDVTHYMDGMPKEFAKGGIMAIPESFINEIKESMSMGYDKIQIGMISPKKKGVMLVNDEYKVRGVYPLSYKDIIEAIIDGKLNNKFAKGGKVNN